MESTLIVGGLRVLKFLFLQSGGGGGGEMHRKYGGREFSSPVVSSIFSLLCFPSCPMTRTPRALP